MCDDLVPIGDVRTPSVYPISIAFCPTCNTAHQSFQIPKHTLFPDSYHYRARHTADVLNGMRELVDHCQVELGDLAGLSVLDVGCNDGSLLSIFAKLGAKTIGIEPTGAAGDALLAGHRVYRDFLSHDLSQKILAENSNPDIITLTNVFAHIEDLPSVVTALRALAGPRTLLVIENHYLGAVLDRYQFDTFYHEHPRTYSLTSFLRIAESLGSQVVSADFPKRYGGNIRVMMSFGGRVARDLPEIAAKLTLERNFETRLLEMGRRIPLWIEAKRYQIESIVTQHGPLPGKAFPGRAAILVRLLGLDETMISAVYEKPGSMKVGHYIPGTRIPILSDDEFASRPNNAAPLLNLAWHISSEIHSYMRSKGFNGDIIDLFSVEEFDNYAR